MTASADLTARSEPLRRGAAKGFPGLTALKRMMLLSAVLAVTSLSAKAETWTPKDTKARQALVVDGETGAILFEKDADRPFPPASLAKLMTMEVVFDAVDKKKLRLDQTFFVSEHAWRTGGAPSGTSTMFAKLKSYVPLDALIRGTIVQAANDAAIVVAEGVAGSEQAFAGLMNDHARRLGLTGSAFVNPTGLPADGQRVTARDLATLARHIQKNHRELYRIYSEPQFEWNKITQRNRNPLLQQDVGATGMATGYTEAAGYSLVGVTEKDGRTTFVVMGGLPSIKDRQDDAKRMIDWSNSSFRRQVLFEAGASVGRTPIYGGLIAEIPVKTREPVVAFVPNNSQDVVTARVVYDWPIRAPVQDWDKVGRIEVMIDGKVSVAQDVFATQGVEQGTFAGRALDAAQELAFGWIRSL